MLGIFDSGFGGLTVLKSVHRVLPDVSTVYLGDNARAPYGTRSHEEVFMFALQGVRELFRRGCPLVVLACNTASAQALRQIQQTVLPSEFPDRRVLGVIRPTAEEIVAASKSGHIGVMATPATVSSGAYLREIADASLTSPYPSPFEGERNFVFPPPDGQGEVRKGSADISQVACPGRLTILIEEGRGTSAVADAIVAACCDELMAKDPLIDTVLLGCTHYPLVENLFRAHLPPSVRIVTQGDIVADKLSDYLARHPDLSARLDRSGIRTYLTTKNDEKLSSLASKFYGKSLDFRAIQYKASH